jgi:uncharacterized membrane protein YcaP (DUF421 family)
MDAVIRVVVMYSFLLIVFRFSGKRTLGESTTFDLLMLLVISETTQQAMVDKDHSMTHAFLLILTFVSINVLLSWLKQRSAWIERLLEGTPFVLVRHGRYLIDRMKMVRVDKDDIIEAARQSHGLERIDQIKYAVLERSGTISIVPQKN